MAVAEADEKGTGGQLGGERLAVEDGTGGGQGGEYTRDGSVDLRGNPVLRSKRGGWTACGFIVVYELFERMAYYGIASNLVIYLTEKLHQGTVEASNNVTNWSGTVFLTPLLGAYVADAYLGRYWTFVVGSAIYFMGMLLLTLSVTVEALKPPSCDGKVCPPASALQVGVYFGGLYIIALGNGGTKPNISTIGADQFDDFDAREKTHKLSENAIPLLLWPPPTIHTIQFLLEIRAVNTGQWGQLGELCK